MRLLQLQVSEQALQEKSTFLEQELHQRRRLMRCIFIFVVVIIIIIVAAAVALVVLQETNDTCVKYLQNMQIGKYVAR